MEPIRLSNDVVPIAKFKATASTWLKHVSDSNRPLVITQNGVPAGVVISPGVYDQHVHRLHFLESIIAGIQDVEAGRVMDTSELKRRLAELRAEE